MVLSARCYVIFISTRISTGGFAIYWCLVALIYGVGGWDGMGRDGLAPPLCSFVYLLREFGIIFFLPVPSISRVRHVLSASIMVSFPNFA